mgnify:CR=1 FL=1
MNITSEQPKIIVVGSSSIDLVLNTDSPLISRLFALHEMGSKDEECNRLALHVFDQARLAHGSLDSEGLKRFLEFNSNILSKNAENM